MEKTYLKEIVLSKYQLIFIIVIILYSCKSQTFDIRGKETLFVLYDNNEYQTKSNFNSSNILINKYAFFNKYESIELISKKYETLDDLEKNQPSINFSIDDSF